MSPNRRHFASDRRPLFYLADTAWKLLHRLNRAECDLYLRDRAAKGFNVIQTALVAGQAGLTGVNAYGYPAVRDGDPSQLVEGYFDHVDWVLHRAGELELTLAITPIWNEPTESGGLGRNAAGARLPLFTPRSARAFGQTLARRFRGSEVMWLVGSEPASASGSVAAVLGRALRGTGKAASLLAVLPRTNAVQSAVVVPEGDFTLCLSPEPASSHGGADTPDGLRRPRTPLPGTAAVVAAYARTPVRPVVACVPGAEQRWPAADAAAARARQDDAGVRRAAYVAVFNGASGVAYASEPVWRFHDPGRAPSGCGCDRWQQAIHLPAAQQLRHLRTLAETYAQSTRVPDPSLVRGNRAGVVALRGVRRGYALVYCGDGAPFRVDVTALRARAFAVRWFDPQDGSWTCGRTVRRHRGMIFNPPKGGRDWVLLLQGAPGSGGG